MSMNLSNHQYPMLRLLLNKGSFTREEAGEYLQPTFTSMVKRGYLTYDCEQGFCATPAARAAKIEFEQGDITRQHPRAELSEFLEQYVARSSRKIRRIRVMKRAG